MALGWLKKIELKKKLRGWTILIFDHFRLVNLEQVLDTIDVTVGWGSTYKLS